MIRKFAFITLALATGFASAAQILPSKSFSTNANDIYTYSFDQAQTGSYILDFTFSFNGKVQNTISSVYGSAMQASPRTMKARISDSRPTATNKAPAPTIFSCVRKEPVVISSRAAT